MPKGRVFDPSTKRWYKDGFAPFQLPELIKATCLSCGQDTLLIGRGGAWCKNCSPWAYETANKTPLRGPCVDERCRYLSDPGVPYHDGPHSWEDTRG